MRCCTFRSKIHRALEENEYGIIIIENSEYPGRPKP